MAKSRRTERQKIQRDYEAFLQEKQQDEERQRKLEEAAEDAYWAHVLEFEAFREAQREEKENQNIPDDDFDDFYYYYDYGFNF